MNIQYGNFFIFWIIIVIVTTNLSLLYRDRKRVTTLLIDRLLQLLYHWHITKAEIEYQIYFHIIFDYKRGQYRALTLSIPTRTEKHLCTNIRTEKFVIYISVALWGYSASVDSPIHRLSISNAAFGWSIGTIWPALYTCKTKTIDY